MIRTSEVMGLLLFGCQPSRPETASVTASGQPFHPGGAPPPPRRDRPPPASRLDAVLCGRGSPRRWRSRRRFQGPVLRARVCASWCLRGAAAVRAAVTAAKVRTSLDELGQGLTLPVVQDFVDFGQGTHRSFTNLFELVFARDEPVVDPLVVEAWFTQELRQFSSRGLAALDEALGLDPHGLESVAQNALLPRA